MPFAEGTKRITVYLTPEQFEALERLRQIEKISAAEIAKQGIAARCELNGIPFPEDQNSWGGKRK